MRKVWQNLLLLFVLIITLMFGGVDISKVNAQWDQVKVPPVVGQSGKILSNDGSQATWDGIGTTLKAGLTTEILVGGGAGNNPVWTTATGTGAPVRATNPSMSGVTLTDLTASLPVFTDGSKKIISKSVVDTISALGLTNAFQYQGAINCSTNPNYPAGDSGDAYVVSVAGKIGGASGADVAAGDMMICKVDGSAAGTQAAVGANWNIVQAAGAYAPAFTSWTQNYFWASPNGSAGVPSARAIVAADLPDTYLPTSQKAAASGVASLDGSSKVVQNPADATATPTGSKIPIADAGGKLDGWISDAVAGTKGKIDPGTPGAIGGNTPSTGAFTSITVATSINAVPFANLNNFFYGVSWNEATDAYARTGFLTGIATASKPADGLLPIQANMRRCVVTDAGVVAYYLSDTDSTKKEDGVTAANLDGTDGQVMVEIPKFYYRHRYVGTTHYWEISPVPLAGFTVHPAFVKNGTTVDNRYIGAYEGVLYDTSLTAYVSGLHQTSVSAVFATADDSITIATRSNWATNLIVGQKLVVTGTENNNATLTVKTVESGTKITVDENLTDETAATTVIQVQTDVTASSGDKLASVSGFAPITGGSANGTRAHFRVYAANRGTGWRQLDYDLASAIQLLYLVEYASFYSQSMIGAGISAVTDWSAYNDSNALAKSGNSNAIGNATGNTAGSTSSATEATKYLSYRGIENWFGHIWKWVDGININNNRSYVSNNDAHWADNTAANYTDIGVNNAAADGYQITLLNVSRGFLPGSVTASAPTTKITDYYYQAVGWCGAMLGGSASYDLGDGGFCLALNASSAHLARSFGGRLCY